MAGAAKRALVILAAGAEEMETVITVDILRRGGIDVTLAGLTGPDPVQCSRQVVIKPDASLDDALKHSPYDAIVLPGGAKGAESLAASTKVADALKSHYAGGQLVAAICAGPISFPAHGIGLGKKVTSHYSVKDKFSGYQYLDERVVQDGKLVTSQGPGTAMEFGLKLVELLQGKQKVNEMIGLTFSNHFHEVWFCRKTRSRFWFPSLVSCESTTERMAERRGPPAQEANRIKGSCFVKPIVYGNIAQALGKKRESDNHTHEWTLYVRPYYKEDMSQYVRKVVFKLHESYVSHTRVITDPPYEVRESGWGEFEATIKIFFVDPAERHVTIYHILKLFNTDPLIVAGKKPLVSEFYDEIVFQEPTLTMYNILNTRMPAIARHDTDFENKRERTLRVLNAARDEVRAELTDLKGCLKEAKELLRKFKEDLSNAEKEATATGSVAGSSASTPPSSNTPGSTSQQEPSSSAGLF